MYADKYAFVFHDEKFRCAECSAAVSKKCDMLRHIRVKHIYAETEKKKSGWKNHGDIFKNKVELNLTQYEGLLESGECDLEDPEISSAPALEVGDSDSNGKVVT